VARWYPSHDQPGRGSFVADLARAVAAEGAEVDVASFDPGHVRGVAETRPIRQTAAEDEFAAAATGGDALNRPRSWGAAGIPVARLPVLLDGERRRPEDVIGAHARPLVAFGVAAHARRPYDVIHAHTGLPDGIAAAQLAAALGIPLVVTEHSSTAATELADEQARVAYLGLLEGRRRLVAVSRALAGEVARALGVEPDRIGILPNAVPVEGFPLGGPTDREPGLLLYVGARKASKGIETLLRAFALAHAGRPGLRLQLIGPPGTAEEESRWRAVAGELGIDGALDVEGPAPREAVAAAMRRASLFVHPSPRETFGMVAAEALASGLPVAATPSGGVDGIVGRDGRFGAVAADHTPEALATAIEDLLRRREALDPAALREHAVRSFAAPAVARQTIGLYRELAEAVGSEAHPALEVHPVSEATPWPVAHPANARAPRPLPLVVAMARGQAVDRVGLLPKAVAESPTVVTSPRGRYADDRDLPSVGRWLELDPERFQRETLEALNHELGGLGRFAAALRGQSPRGRRADVDGRRDEIRAEGLRAFLLEAARAAGAIEADGTAWVVCPDADDVLLVRAADAAGLRLAPGGLRWLADRWDEDQA
jgi:glycosyltransferase involved in cell wall biosynthesis